jgi:signal transduction histidine kinase/ActR/RegA family two-component response regulator
MFTWPNGRRAPFPREDEEILSAVADQLGTAIRNARLFHESEERGKRLTTLVEGTQQFTRGLDLPDVLNAIAEAAAMLFDGEATIRIREGDELVWTTGTQIAFSLPFKKRLRIGESFAGIAAQTGEPILITDLKNDDRIIPEHKTFQIPEELCSMMLIPLLLESRVVGVLNVYRERGYEFSSDDVRIATTFAAQAAIAIENARLFEEVQDRTIDLERARDEAEAVNRVKSDFLSNVSHDIRSPLNTVLGFSELLLMLTKESKILDIADKIRESGKYITRLFDDLLDLDRIETGKVRLDMQETSINDLIGEIVDGRKAQFPAGYKLKSSFDPGCGLVTCDPLRINQILTNLIDNAIKYSPEGGVIRITTEAALGEARVTVEDKGIGMTPEETNVIFERFSQLESGMMRRGGGLGLNIVKRLVEYHDGRIMVKSEKGKGSAFSFALPMSPVGKFKDPGKKSGRRRRTRMSEVDPWSDKKILIVDDLEHYHEYIKVLIGSAKEIISAYNGKEGIEADMREKPDLILMDLRMPILDGFETIERLKSGLATKEIPVLAVTAQAMAKDRKRCLELGADGFVTKPIEIEKLRGEIEAALGKPVLH